MATFGLAIDTVLKHEGGFINHPSDPGGATNYGISLRLLEGLDKDINLDGVIDLKDIQSLTKEGSIQIYKEFFWDKYNYASIVDQNVATKIFDTCVNLGPVQTHKLVQRACNLLLAGQPLKVDGILGKISIFKLNSVNQIRFLSIFRLYQLSFYTNLVVKDSGKFPFLNGWVNRANS